MKSLIERGECPMRHENGNCTVAGGFCTAVNDPICEALHNAFYCGEYSNRKNGYSVTLPCKVGDTVWIRGDRFPAVIEEIRITDDGVYFTYVEYDKGYEETEVWDNDEFTLFDIGKTVFLTRETAEKALEDA